MSRRGNRPGGPAMTFAVTALGLILALAIGACGGGGGSSASTGGGTGEAGVASGGSEVARAKAELAKLYKGEYGTPNPEAPAHKPGEKVWDVVSGFESAAAKREGEEFATAAKELGWDPTVRDGKFNSTTQLAAIREAIRADADAILLELIDCETVKAGIQEARRAGIVVVSSNATDCEPPLFSGETEYEQGDIAAYSKRGGEAQALWAIANADAEAKVLLVYENDLSSAKAINAAAKARFEECASCEVVGEVTFSGAELGPPLQQKVEQALLKYPEATVVDGNYDAAVELGVAPAVRSSGKEIFVLGFEGEPNTMKRIRDGEQAMGVGYPVGWVAWSGVDAMVRLLAGEKEVGGSGAGLQVFDAEHNLAPEGQAFSPPVDYKQLYREAWGL